jgi:CRP/FNR family cyclic AMP-dependent transcriptional regulator
VGVDRKIEKKERATMIERLCGDAGRRLRTDAFAGQKIVAGNAALASELAELAEISEVKAGVALIEQGDFDNDIYFILAGLFTVMVNGRAVQRRGPGDTVGEMAAVEPVQRRSASVIAHEDSVVGKVSEAALSELGSRYPDIWRFIARELARRLMQRNALVNGMRQKIRVFIISSAEALPIAREIQDAFAHDQFTTKVWTDGVFRVAGYTLQSLEDEVDQSDFAIAVAHPDDTTVSRDVKWPSARDNVIFELGLFMGRLGRQRAILMEPRKEKIKLPSDLAGVTTVSYLYETGSDAAAYMAPACNALRKHILALGPNN